MSKWEYSQKTFLVKNSENVIFLYGDPSGSMMATNSVILECNQGDVIFVKARDDDCYIRVYDKAATTFSGWMM